MSADPFSGPAQGGKITDYEGALLLITPTAYLEEVPTTFGEKDAVEANVVVLDEPKGGFPEDEGPAPLEVDGVRFFQGVLISQTKAKIGKGMVLGRLGQRPPSQPGHNPAWALEDPTDADKEAAREFLKTKEPFA